MNFITDQQMWNNYKNKKALFILDNIDDLIISSKDEVRIFL